VTDQHESGQGFPTAEAVHDLFVNPRGELINAKVELLTDPERGEAWRAWAAKHLPVDVFRAFGMLEVEGSEEWLNVVEHNVFVAATSLTIGQRLAEAGVPVHLPALVRAAIVHDASKRLDVERKMSREEEAFDKTFESVVSKFDYTPGEIDAAKNTGRLPDRYEQNPVERMRAIANHSIEANIIGYADARTRNTHVVSLHQAMADSVAAKPKDEVFFTQNWRPYYDAVEAYFQTLTPNFDPAQLTDAAVFATVQQSAA
jgi:hypothetical protein